jgi:hypothetical protein
MPARARWRQLAVEVWPGELRSFALPPRSASRCSLSASPRPGRPSRRPVVTAGGPQGAPVAATSLLLSMRSGSELEASRDPTQGCFRTEAATPRRRRECLREHERRADRHRGAKPGFRQTRGSPRRRASDAVADRSDVPAFTRPRVLATVQHGTNPRPRFEVARGLLAANASALLVANCASLSRAREIAPHSRDCRFLAPCHLCRHCASLGSGADGPASRGRQAAQHLLTTRLPPRPFSPLLTALSRSGVPRGLKTCSRSLRVPGSVRQLAVARALHS